MMDIRPTARRRILLVGAIVLLIVVLPWIAALWTHASLFGFPAAGFLTLLLGPAILVVIAGMGERADHIDAEEK
jgi:4-amino-4-deoxy-L-arabinose transferase-like glycosyltransferase